MAAINVHQAKDGTMTYRVRVRRRGQPTQTASFSTLKAARQWATMIEGDIIAACHFPNKKPKHTLNALLDRYVQEIMPRKTLETQRARRPVVTFWRQKLGHKLLSYMQRLILPLFGELMGDPPTQSVLLPDHASACTNFGKDCKISGSPISKDAVSPRAARFPIIP